MSRSKLLVVIASFIITFYAFGIRYTYGMLLPEMMVELNLSNTEAGSVYTSFFILYIIFSIVVGFLSDIKSIKKIVISFLPFLGIGTFMMGLTNSYLSSLVFFGLVGVGASIGWVPLVVWCQKTYPSRRGFVLGIVQVGCNLGWSTIGLILPYLISAVGWRGVWMVLGLSLLIIATPTTMLTHEQEVKTTNSYSLLNHFRSFTKVLKNKRFLIGGLSYALTSFAIMIHLTFFKAYTVFELGIEYSLATLLYGIVGIIAIAGSLFTSLYTSRIGTYYSLIICNVMLMLGLLLITFSTLSIAIPIIFIGVSYGMIWPLYATLVKDLFEWEVVGSVMGSWTLMCGLGLSLSSFTGGLLADIYRSYKPPYIIGSIFALISVLLICYLGKVKS